MAWFDDNEDWIMGWDLDDYVPAPTPEEEEEARARWIAKQRGKPEDDFAPLAEGEQP